MTEHPYIALCRAVKTRLTAASEIWGQQVGEVPLATWPKPYVQMYYIAGGESNNIIAQDADYDLGIKVVSEDMEESLIGAARLTALLNDQGVQDRPTTYLYGGSDWEICTATQGRAIHIVEPFAQSQFFYHDGHVFSFVLGRV